MTKTITKLLLNGETYQIKEYVVPFREEYHIPSVDEYTALIAAMTTLGIDTSTGDCMKTYLKMPFAGHRYYSSAIIVNQGTAANYWLSTVYDATSANDIYFMSSGLYQHRNFYANGFSVRCFKTSPTIPTNSWTTLYQGTSGAGIFHNTVDGLISISSDGINWITIQDKNLGATTVYNDGDTLSEANCGKYYQRGNCYGFPWIGNVTTSGTQIDASGYGPYKYESDTFIIGYKNWSSVQNDNLWGGASS